MKVFFHSDFYRSYTSDPAAAPGRMEAAVKALGDTVQWPEIQPATEADILLAHSQSHLADVRREGLYDIAALAAGGAMQAAKTALTEPAFALIRPPGHHASADSAWGFCYFNNMAIALSALKQDRQIETAFVLDIDLHYGDGNENILAPLDWVRVFNPEERSSHHYIRKTAAALSGLQTDIIGISAGFDNHQRDWGGLLSTTDYHDLGALVRATADQQKAGCFAILEGGYNHDVLGQNIAALIRGMEG